MPVVSNRLRRARERKGYTQIYVRDKTGINNKTLSGYEKGISEPDYDTLIKLSSIYEVSVEWLLGTTDDPTPKKSMKLSDTEQDILRILRNMPESEVNYIADLIKKISKE